MPKDPSVKKVLVIGSGPIVIGQAAEFDYAGTQACRTLVQEGLEVVLINSNPATIMTDPGPSVRVYIEPLTLDSVKRIIEIERPDSLLPGLGGQTGLNMAMELNDCGFLAQMNVRLLGTPAESIRLAEDRQAFRDLLIEIGEPVIDNTIATTVEEAERFAREIGFPVIVRPAYTLGGAGGGRAEDVEQLRDICRNGLRLSRVHQVLVERCIAGYKEIEYEVMRDADDCVVSVCDMENIDPVGIHTGDSIVVAPCQSLSAAQLDMLKASAFRIIRALKIHGGCNVQYALNPTSDEYFVIEVNPRVSRSSALASKATGYPIAKVTARVALGYHLDEISHKPGCAPYAHVSPRVPYTVIKFPRWPFDKFTKADKQLGTRMKATGEVMAIGENFEAAFNKAVRSLELGFYSLALRGVDALSDGELRAHIARMDDERIFLICEALRREISVDELYAATMIDPWFLTRLRAMVRMEQDIKALRLDCLDEQTLRAAKLWGMTDRAIAEAVGAPEHELRALRERLGILPRFVRVDTAPAGASSLPYYYSAYGLPDDLPAPSENTVAVLGAGPIRIGQGIEFDYCSVHAIEALRRLGSFTVTINCNPETVSTDFDTSDLLFFEPLTPEDVAAVLTRVQPTGVSVQFGGQTAIKLSHAVSRAGFRVLGTSTHGMDLAEDRGEFDAMLTRLDLARPKGGTAMTPEQAVAVADSLGYPVLVRPSYVLGGQGMEICYSSADVAEYMGIIARSALEYEVLVDKYLMGREVEVDAICDGEEILIPGIMEHVERAGVHSGDSISIYPAQSLSNSMCHRILETTRALARGLGAVGLINVQYIVRGNELYIIEANPRSSRTVPFITKVTGIPMVELATRAMLGEHLADMGYGLNIAPNAGVVAVKAPVFSFEKLPEVEVSLGPEMKSTGEALGIAHDMPHALYKALLAAGLTLERAGVVLLSVAGADRNELVPIAESFEKLGYKLYGTPGTARFLNGEYVGTSSVKKLHEDEEQMLRLLTEGRVAMIICTPTRGRQPERDGFRLRRLATERSIPCLTSLDTARALASCLMTLGERQVPVPVCLSDLGQKAAVSHQKA